MHKVLVIGAVNSTAQIVKSIFRHGFNIVGILGHEPIVKEKVAGWFNLNQLSADLNINYKGFVKINDEVNLKWASDLEPDIIFAVGFSQLLDKSWFSIPKLGVIGFHPTLLPTGRGRAPLAWLLLEEKQGAATFFLMGEGADDGPIFVQSSFNIDDDDDAGSVERKILISIDKALDEWLPRLINGEWNPIPQDETKASWYGKRSSEDGKIDWNDAAYKINRVIKASSKPHPGAYTFYQNKKVIIWKSRLEEKLRIKGVPGRVLLKNNSSEYLVQTGNGLIWVSYLEGEKLSTIKVGDKLGYVADNEIFKIWQVIKELKKNE